MTEIFYSLISKALGIPARQVEKTMGLLDEGATIPFISRYRKEVTGGLDEVQIGDINDHYGKLKEVSKRKETILASIDEQGKLTPELKKRIEASWDSTELEDIYLPYKPKRQTKAEIARKKGLEPLATLLMLQTAQDSTKAASPYVKGEVKDVREALQGARDIIAEWVNEDEQARNTVRNSFSRTAVISSKVVKGKEEEGSKYRDYFDFSEPLNRCSSHRLLALRRGEAEGFLKVVETFGPQIVDADGTLNRTALAEIVFNDKAALKRLEEIIHHYVWQETDKFLSECQQSGQHAAVLDIPLLIECGWHQKVDEVWLVVLPVEKQIMRTMKRSGMTAEAVQARIAAQMPLEEKKKYATLIIDNSGAWEETEKQVITAWEKAVK